MKYLTLAISDIDRLNSISLKLSEKEPISDDDQRYLSEFLIQLPTTQILLAHDFPIDDAIFAKLWNMDNLEYSLKNWKRLFDNIPGYDYVGCYMFDMLDNELLNQGVVMTAVFAPTLSYNFSNDNEGFEIYLKDDGSAIFNFPTIADARQYFELFNFRGSWKEAYSLLIETLKKGWPMEEFPEELRQFLKKE